MGAWTYLLYIVPIFDRKRLHIEKCNRIFSRKLGGLFLEYNLSQNFDIPSKLPSLTTWRFAHYYQMARRAEGLICVPSLTACVQYHTH